MADTNLHSETVAAQTFDAQRQHIAELCEMAEHASTLETIIEEVRALLGAIEAAEMLVELPEDESARKLQTAAIYLLDIAARRLSDVEKIPGTDLSIKLSVDATQAERSLMLAERQAA